MAHHSGKVDGDYVVNDRYNRKMWSDRESAKDFLNFTELADQISTLSTTADMLPLSIGVFGTWGTGKSTVLRLVRSKLEERETEPIFIDFDGSCPIAWCNSRLAGRFRRPS